MYWTPLYIYLSPQETHQNKILHLALWKALTGYNKGDEKWRPKRLSQEIKQTTAIYQGRSGLRKAPKRRLAVEIIYNQYSLLHKNNKECPFIITLKFYLSIFMDTREIFFFLRSLRNLDTFSFWFESYCCC